MNYGNCDITIKDNKGNCVTYFASCAIVDMEQEFVEVCNSCSGEVKKLSVGKTIKLEAKLYDRSCEIIQPCNPPKKPGLIKRIIRKIV